MKTLNCWHKTCTGALLQSYTRIEKPPLLTLSVKSSVSGGSQTPFTDKSIKSVQCTALKLIIGIFLNLFLTGFPLLKEYKK